jgi:formyltetrahydrofolate synthetase
MLVLMKDALQPTLMQTIEQTPVLVHAGPFANIAHGNSSIVADQIALKLSGEDGFCITEAGFGADIGMEKFFNIKCRYSGLDPRCTVIVATVRALKMHGGGPPVVAGAAPDDVYNTEQLDLVRAGCANLVHHVRNVAKHGIRAVVAINQFTHDTPAEIQLIEELCLEAGAFAAVRSNHWTEGGAGAVQLANAVIDACAAAKAQEASTFKCLYPLELSLKEKIESVCVNIYGAAKVEYSEQAEARLAQFTAASYDKLPICMAKTQYSLSTDASLKGVPTGFTVVIRDVRAAVGAGYIYPLCGTKELESAPILRALHIYLPYVLYYSLIKNINVNHCILSINPLYVCCVVLCCAVLCCVASPGNIMTIPGLTTRPGFYDVDIDFSTGRIIGLF